jgi:hypothetical protein
MARVEDPSAVDDDGCAHLVFAYVNQAVKLTVGAHKHKCTRASLFALYFLASA